MTLRPLLDRILVRPLPVDTTTRGGILIPATAQKRSARAVVVAVGPGPRRRDGTHIPMAPQVGDTVWFAEYNGIDLTMDGEQLLVLYERDVVGVEEGRPARRKTSQKQEDEMVTVMEKVKWSK